MPQLSDQQNSVRTLLELTAATKSAVLQRYVEIKNSLNGTFDEVTRVVQSWQLHAAMLVQTDFDVQSSRIDRMCGLIRQLLEKLQSCIMILHPEDLAASRLDDTELSSEAVETLSALWMPVEEIWNTINLVFPRHHDLRSVEDASPELQKALFPEAECYNQNLIPVSQV
jgi:hypothetical protein